VARFTESHIYESTRQGATPRWFVTRYKAICDEFAAFVPEMGTAADHGPDPAIASIPYDKIGASGICEFPTHKGWSAETETMQFRFEIVGNAANDLTIDVTYYEAVYGTTEEIESWHAIGSDYGIGNGDTREVGTSGGRILVHIDAVNNPDSSAQLYVSARRGSSIQLLGAGGEAAALIVDGGVESLGVRGWYATLGRWLRIAVDSAGALVVSGLSGMATVLSIVLSNLILVLADTTAIKTAIQILDDVVNTHDAAAGTKGVLMMGKASAGVPAAVGDGDAVSDRRDLTGSAGVHLTAGTDYTTSSITTRETPGSGYAHGTRDCTAANTAYPLAAASTPCFAVLMCAREANAGLCITGASTITTTGGPVPKISVGSTGWTFVDDLAKVCVASSNAGDDVDFVYLTR